MPKPVIIWTTEELIALLGGSRQNVSRIAAEQGWTRASGYTGDIDKYLWSRWRFELAREMGTKVKGLVCHDEWDKDDNCPVCDSFAIYRPARPEEIANLDIDVYGQDWPWRCIKGHTGP